MMAAKARQRRGVRVAEGHGQACPGDTAVERGKSGVRPLHAVRHTTAVSRRGLPPHSTTLARIPIAPDQSRHSGDTPGQA